MKSDPNYQAKWFKTVKDYKESSLSMKRYASKNSIKYYQLCLLYTSDAADE